MTSTQNSGTYYYDRAETELRMAQKASQPEAVRAHYELANLYLDRFYNSDRAQPENDD